MGRTLGERLGALIRGALAEQMPYGDPHIAVPGFWALRSSEDCDFEASVLPVIGTKVKRLTPEVVTISRYRTEAGRLAYSQFRWLPSRIPPFVR